jgi:DNA-binding transcriptional MocR family regulator
MDRDGVIPDAFEDACARHRPTAAYLMPTVHNPTTTVLTDARRRRLVEIARRHRVTLVEDDVYGFLAADAPPPLRSYAPDRVIYVSSLSKSVAPGLRVGYVVGPEPVMPAISAALRTMVLMSAPMQSELAMHLIDSGLAAEAADRQRAVARRRQQMAASILGALYSPRWAGGGGAFHVWLPLPEPWRVNDFVTTMRDRGVAVTPGDSFHVEADAHEVPGAVAVPRSAVRLCLNGAENDDDVRQGLELIAATLRQQAHDVLPVI